MLLTQTQKASYHLVLGKCMVHTPELCYLHLHGCALPHEAHLCCELFGTSEELNLRCFFIPLVYCLDLLEGWALALRAGAEGPG